MNWLNPENGRNSRTLSWTRLNLFGYSYLSHFNTECQQLQVFNPRIGPGFSVSNSPIRGLPRRPTWQTSLVVQISVLVVQFSMLIVLLVVLLHEILWPHASCWWVQVLLGVVHPLGRTQQNALNTLTGLTRAETVDLATGSCSSYLHAVVDVVDHGEALSVLHSLPVLRGPLPGTNNAVLTLWSWYGEVIPGVGLGGDGVSLWTGRRGFILAEENQKRQLWSENTHKSFPKQKPATASLNIAAPWK